MKKTTMFMEQQIDVDTIRYIRMVTIGNKVEYLECILQSGVVIDYNEEVADLNMISKVINYPSIKGISPLVFSEKTGIPL